MPGAMTPRQRVGAAFRRQVPDRVPRHLGFTPYLQQQLVERTGHTRAEEAFDLEMRHVGFKPSLEPPDFARYLPTDLPPGTTSDEWGLTEKPGSFFHFTEYVYPMINLSDASELDDWPFPDFTPAYRFEGVPERVAELHEQGYWAVGSVGHIFVYSWYIRSMEQLFLDMRLNKAFATRLLDEITARQVYRAVKFAEAGVDAIATGDDVGSQKGMIMSPAMWREWFKPRWAEVWAAAKAVNPDVIITYHSDGDITTIIPELIEIGLDVLNPVQPECLDIAALKRDFGDAVAFYGGMGTQTTMPFGTPDEVRAEVRRLIDILGAGGGFLIAPTHVLEPDVSWENIEAFLDEVQQYGVYA